MKRRIFAMLLAMILLAGILPARVQGAGASYITDIAVAYGAKSSTAEKLLTGNGYRIVTWNGSSDLFDFNDGAGGYYIYMGYKTSTSYSNAITGILFRTGGNCPNSLTYKGATFYLLGGSNEGNGSGDGKVDMNVDAGGDYIYTYITRDKNYGPALTDLKGAAATSVSGFTVAPNTGGSAANLNSGTGDRAIYLQMKNYGHSSNFNTKVHYLYDTYSVLAPTVSGGFSYEGHVVTPTSYIVNGNNYLPPTTAVNYKNGATYTLYGWTNSNTGTSVLFTGPFRIDESMKASDYYGVYQRVVTVKFDPNGGTGCSQSSVSRTIYENVDAHILHNSPATISISFNVTAAHGDPCLAFAGWSEVKDGSPIYSANSSVTTTQDKTLYAAWKPNHSCTTTAARAATCTEAGNSEYKTCKNCGKYFNSSDQEIAKDSWIIPANSTSHSFGNLIPLQEEVHTRSTLQGAVAAHYRCTSCGKYFTKDKTETSLAALTAPTPTHDTAGTVNKDATGHWPTCSVCGLEYPDSKSEHSYTDPGDTSCNVCGYERAPSTYGVSVKESGSVGGKYRVEQGTVTYGQTYVTNVYTTASDAWYVQVNDVKVNGNSVAFSYDNRETLTVDGGAITGSVEIDATVMAKVTFDLNGGNATEELKARLESAGIVIEDGKFSVPMAYGVPGTFGDLVDSYARENYTPSGLEDASTGNMADLDANIVNCELRVQWQCNHVTDESLWQEATCTNPKTCTNCGETEGEALGHDWTDATCTAPKTCTNCGETEGEALDHDWLDATCTAPKTCDLCGTTEGEALGHTDDDNNGYCDICTERLSPAILHGRSLSLKGDIAINFYMDLSNEVLADDSAYMEFRKEDGTIIHLPLAEATKKLRNTGDYYVFTIPMTSKEMADVVEAQFFWSEGSTETYTYSVKTYVDNTLPTCENEALKNLLTAMLHYGAAAQTYFGYHTDRLANQGLAAADYSGVNIEGFTAEKGQATKLLSYYRASLQLNSRTGIRFVFLADSSLQEITATCNGETLEWTRDGNVISVIVDDISAKDLDEYVTITVSDGKDSIEVSYSPMTYCQNVQNGNKASHTPELKTLVDALYVYNQAANVYFGDN